MAKGAAFFLYRRDSRAVNIQADRGILWDKNNVGFRFALPDLPTYQLPTVAWAGLTNHFHLLLRCGGAERTKRGTGGGMG
jgi:hypothetical protein